MSVIITTRNRLSLLKEAIDSVLSQTYKNVELIVVSDNSSDGTDEYCKSLNNITFVPLKSGVGGGNVTPIYYVKEALVYYLNDSSDKNRISNQPERLRIAVKYIFKKYKYRLLRLSPIDFYLFLDTIAIEFLGKMKKHTLCYFLTTIFVAVNFKIKKIGKWKEYRIVNQ